MQKTRRQFSVEIIKCDGFISMPATAQALYFQLLGSCDDEGFTSSIDLCKYMAHASDEDEQLLIKRRFIIQLDSEDHKITVIKHWRQNNWIQKDRAIQTLFSERSKIYVKPNGNYTLDPTQGEPLDRRMLNKCLASDKQVPSKCLADDKQVIDIAGAAGAPNPPAQCARPSNPIQSNPIQSNPIHNNPIQSNSNHTADLAREYEDADIDLDDL